MGPSRFELESEDPQSPRMPGYPMAPFLYYSTHKYMYVFTPQKELKGHICFLSTCMEVNRGISLRLLLSHIVLQNYCFHHIHKIYHTLSYSIIHAYLLMVRIDDRWICYYLQSKVCTFTLSSVTQIPRGTRSGSMTMLTLGMVFSSQFQDLSLH